MEDRTAPCSVLLIGENPSDTAAIQHALAQVRPDAPVTIARHHNDVAHSLAACGLSGFRAVFLFASTLEDAEMLSIIRGAPGGGTTRLVVLIREEFVGQTRSFYVRGAHSVVLWPQDAHERERLAERLLVYWEELNLPCVSETTAAKDRQIAVL